MAESILEFIISIFTYKANANYAIVLNPVTTKLLVSAGVSILGGMFGRKKRRRELKAANAERKEMKQEYMNMDFSNPYENLSNAYDGMENPMEDLTVNLQQAQFKADQQAQQQVNTMDMLRGAAGSSGVAGLAQTMLNQKVKKKEEASASIGLQESQNRQLTSKAALSIDSARRGQDMKNEVAMAKGVRETQKLEQQRTETLYGMSMQRAAAAKQAKNAATKAMIGGVGSALTGYAGTATGAHNINALFNKDMPFKF